jgi:hypothetical protein
MHDATQVSQHRRAQHALRCDLEVTLMIAAMALASAVSVFLSLSR